jgi:hypothetical protein
MKREPLTLPPETYQGFTYELYRSGEIGFLARVTSAPTGLRGGAYIALEGPNPLTGIPVAFGFTPELARTAAIRQFNADLAGKTLSEYLGIRPVYPLQEILPTEEELITRKH